MDCNPDQCRLLKLEQDVRLDDGFMTFALQSAAMALHAAVSMSLCAIHEVSGTGEGGWRGGGGLEANYTAGGKI